MTHILKNKPLEIHIDMPLEGYKGARFDWTGKLVSLKFQNMELAGVENPESENEDDLGKGFYNEFGIDYALGFEEAAVGGWFHKIGIGLLKKKDSPYHISKPYEIKPANFTVHKEADRLSIKCTSEIVNGYGYILKKEFLLKDSGFTINYSLENTGTKAIVTDEYVHNFTAFNKTPIGKSCTLKFPFQLQPTKFEETVNPEQKVNVGETDLKFKATPKVPFFFSNLSGDASIKAQWELIDLKTKIGIRETGRFKTDKVNVWGSQHVICPELFFKIALQPGASTAWSRDYEVYKVD